MRRLVLAGALYGCALSAHALSGEEMFNYCESNACGGYFIGAFDAVRIAAALTGEKPRSTLTGKKQNGRALSFNEKNNQEKNNKAQSSTLAICAPDDVSDEEIIDVALNYLQRNPQTRHLQAANLALRAWREQWPCRG
ncbi:MAG: hypothetical protein JWM78_2736 [Verrucomicrobiaceae bacterium]|nr:hypothetical protein [Verrucomicrobiaceae bacterium]